MATSAICAGSAETGRVKLEAVLEIVPIPINFRASEIGAILTTLRDKKMKVRIVGKIWMKTRGIRWAGN